MIKERSLRADAWPLAMGLMMGISIHAAYDSALEEHASNVTVKKLRAPVVKRPLDDKQLRQTFTEKMLTREGYQIIRQTSSRADPDAYLDTYSLKKAQDDGHVYSMTVIIDPFQESIRRGEALDRGLRINALRP